MMNFSTLQGLSIPDGVVTEIKDESGRVLWALSGDKVILQVEKITSDTYAGEITYTGESFILLDIYPKTNGTAKVTYGGLTKIITDTSGVEDPNAQQVFFGTFNGVSDSVATPTSGELTIEGDYYAFSCGQYDKDLKDFLQTCCLCVTSINSFGSTSKIPNCAFGNVTVGGCEKITSVKIPNSVTIIGEYAFCGCLGLASLDLGKRVTIICDYAFIGCVSLTSITIPSSVKSIGREPWTGCSALTDITVDSGNTFYKMDGKCLIEIATNKIFKGFSDSVIPSYVEVIGLNAFANCTELTDVILPSVLTTIEGNAFGSCKALTNLTIPSSVTSIGMTALSNCSNLTSVTFENTTNWYVSESVDHIEPISVDVSNPTNNATLFTKPPSSGGYSTYYWFRQV